MGQRRHSKHHGIFTITLAAVLLAAGVWHFVDLSRADVTQTVTVTALVQGCGDGIIELGEDCDGSNMNGHTCTTEGYLSGSISCSPSCTLDTSSCSMTPPSSGGGNTGNPPPVSSSSETFTGFAYPGSVVTVLKDGQLAGSTTADAVGEFLIRFDNLTNGTYTFGFSTVDADGNHSALTALSVAASGGINTIGNIFLSPTITPVTEAVTPGVPVVVSGQTAPNASVTITVTSDANAVVATFSVVADSAGAYSTSFPTDSLTGGTYSLTAVAVKNSLTSTPSLPMEITAGPLPVAYMKGDFNEDQRVNLIDFSIALYWYKEDLSDAFKVLEIRHGNGDGLLNLIDISIIAYWWTG